MKLVYALILIALASFEFNQVNTTSLVKDDKFYFRPGDFTGLDSGFKKAEPIHDDPTAVNLAKEYADNIRYFLFYRFEKMAKLTVPRKVPFDKEALVTAYRKNMGKIFKTYLDRLKQRAKALNKAVRVSVRAFQKYPKNYLINRKTGQVTPTDTSTLEELFTSGIPGYPGYTIEDPIKAAQFIQPLLSKIKRKLTTEEEKIFARFEEKDSLTRNYHTSNINFYFLIGKKRVGRSNKWVSLGHFHERLPRVVSDIFQSKINFDLTKDLSPQVETICKKTTTNPATDHLFLKTCSIKPTSVSSTFEAFCDILAVYNCKKVPNKWHHMIEGLVYSSNLRLKLKDTLSDKAKTFLKELAYKKLLADFKTHFASQLA